MKFTFSESLLLLAACSFAPLANASADDCTVYSKDHLSVTGDCSGDEQQPGGIATGSATGVPYGTVPDWQNDIRLAVAAVQIHDMNGDGWRDLIVGCFANSGFPAYPVWRNFIYYNTGGQLEAQPSWTSADQVHTGDIQIADINLDGFPDILSVNGGSANSKSVIYWGGKGGPDNVPDVQFNAPQATWALSAAVFDFDHDGDVDIITTNQTAIQNDWYRPLYMYRNFASEGGDIETFPSWQTDDIMISNGIDVGDYDNDGWEDIAVGKWINFEAAIYKNQSGTFQTLPIWSSGDTGGARGTGFSDFDKNGWLDLVIGYDPTRLYSNDKTVLTQTWETTAPFSGAQELHVYDFDHDGDDDIAEVYFSTGRTHLYLNNGGVFNTVPDWTYDAPTVANALTFGDINGDGCDDLAIGLSGDISVRIFYAKCLPACPADVAPDGGNGTIDVDDLLLVINNWGAQGSNPADITGNEIVDVDDLLAVINAWGACE
jgi:hypothetical protein